MKKLVIYYIIMYLNPVINNNSTRQHSFNIKKQASNIASCWVTKWFYFIIAFILTFVQNIILHL